MLMTEMEMAVKKEQWNEYRHQATNDSLFTELLKTIANGISNFDEICKSNYIYC